MTPREKAEEITLLYYNLGKHLYVPISFAKQCALIAVDELIYETQFEVPNVRQKYWINVKHEIEKL
jgi:hypothetical protein